MTTAVRLRPQARATMARRIRYRRRAFATRLAGLLREFFAAQRQRVLARLSYDAHLHEALKALPPPAEQLLPPSEDNLLRLAIQPFLDSAILNAADLAALLAGGVFDPNSYSQGVQRLLDQAGTRIVGINDATRNAVREQLQQGNAAGYSLYQLANGVAEDGYRGIGSVVENLYANRAEAIARTELGQASQNASREQWSEMGVQYQEIIDGEDFDDECAGRNGDVVPIDQEVNLNHPNCTVVSLPVVLSNATILQPLEGGGGEEGTGGGGFPSFNTNAIFGATPAQEKSIVEAVDQTAHSSLVREIRIVNTKSERLALSGRTEGDRINIAVSGGSKAQLQDVVRHETGHVVWNQALTQAERDEWLQASRQLSLAFGNSTEKVEAYVREVSQLRLPEGAQHVYKKAGEYFAEMYNWYFGSPSVRAYLETNYPRRFASIKTIVERFVTSFEGKMSELGTYEESELDELLAARCTMVLE